MIRRSFLFACLALTTVGVYAQRKPAEVVLTAPPVVERLRTARGAAAENYRTALRRGKSPLVAALASRGVPVDFQLEVLLNAIMIEATDDDLVWLRTQPGVKSAEYSRRAYMNLDFATGLIGAPQVWAKLAGGADDAGRGIKIGLVDSGIDQTHPMFNDTGFSLPAGWNPQGSVAAYTNNKVIVARNFVKSESTPADGIGHGTFVGSVAAGRSTVTPVGTTINGVAPGAWLGSYKVFSATGSGAQSAVLAAFEAAIDDHMDIVNYSGGMEPGTLSALDSLGTVVRNANTAGMVIVVAAGNCGPKGSTSNGACVALGDFTISSPADVSAVIAAGASTNGHILAQALHITPGAPDNLQSVPFRAGDSPGISFNFGPFGMADVTPLDSTSLGCSSFPSGSLSGKVALIKRGICNFSVKVNNAAQGGAIGVLFYDNLTETLPSITTTGSNLPSGIVSASDGAAILAYLAAQTDAQVTMDAGQSFVTRGVIADQVSNYSSRGPNPDYAIKPDLVAPGDMYAAAQNTNSSGEVYSFNRFVSAQGTSFAAPMTTGAAAIVKAANPALSPADIKSALVNTATLVTATQDGVPVSVMNAGAGRLNLPAALATTLTADPVSLSFGIVSNAGAGTATLKNVGSQTETFDVTVSESVSDAGLHMVASPSQITLGAGQTTTLTLTGTTTATQQGIFEGFVTVKSKSTPTSIRIPYWMMFGRPAIFTGGLVDAAGYGHQLAPGEMASLFGTSLGAPGLGIGASTIPLPTDVAHSVVTIAQGSTTTAVPLFYSSAGQLNLQLPFTLTPGVNATVTATLAGITGSNIISFIPAAAGPGVFTSPPDGKSAAIALHQDYSLVTAANPARVGETISLYCTGLGAVSPVVAAGAAAPASPTSTTPSNPTVMIGGQAGLVSFSGLAPTFAGLYQVNVQVPSVASGSQTLTMIMSGITGNTATITVQ